MNSPIIARLLISSSPDNCSRTKCRYSFVDAMLFSSTPLGSLYRVPDYSLQLLRRYLPHITQINLVVHPLIRYIKCISLFFHKSVHCIRKDQRGEELRRIDLGQVSWEGCKNPRIFGISAGLGLDALVCKKALTSRLKQVLNRFHLGKLTYLALTVQSLFTMETANAKVITEHGGYILPKMIFAASMNLPAEGGGVPMAPDASPQDGLLSLSSAAGIAKWRTFFLLPLLVAAKQEGIKGFNIRDEKGFRVVLDKPMVLHADGEYCGDVTRVEFRCLERKLWLLHE